MTLVSTGSINSSTDGPTFLREIFSLKSILLSLIALIDSSQVWLHFAKSKANPVVLPGCFRAIDLPLPSLAGLGPITKNDSRAGNLKVFIVKSWDRFTQLICSGSVNMMNLPWKQLAGAPSSGMDCLTTEQLPRSCSLLASVHTPWGWWSY